MTSLREALDERRKITASRLGAPSGVATGSKQPVGSRLSAPAPDPSTLDQLGHAVQFATSGQTFIQDLTGFDINSLPGVVSKPLDFVVNPVGIASLLAAIPSGGTSLAGLGARGVGARVAGAAIKDVVGGLAGTEAGKLAAEYTPGPDWLKAGAGLGVGALVGGKVAGSVGRRLPAGFDAASPNLTPKQVEAIKLNKKIDLRANPINLEDADLELDKLQQISNAVKAATGQGVKAQALTTPILDKSAASLNTARDQLKLLQFRWTAAKVHKDMGIVDADAATMIKAANRATGAEELVPLADAAAHPSLYQLTKFQENTLRKISQDLDTYHKAYRSQGGRIGVRKDIEPGGFYLPRGIENEFPGMPYATKRGLLKNPDAAKTAQYATQAEAIANGLKYPKFEDALEDYVMGLSQATVGRSAANQLAKIPGPDGRPLLVTAEELLPKELTRSYLSAEAKAYGLDFKLQNAQSDLHQAQLQREALDSASFLNTGSAKAALDKKIADLTQVVTDIKTEQVNHATIFESVKSVYSNELAKVKTDPTLGTLEPTNLPSWMGARGDKFYGPKEITDAINAQLNPNGIWENGRRVSNSVSNHLRLLHTVADISDFGRLAGTAGLEHPFDFFKGIQTGFKSMFSPSAMAQDFKGIDAELAAAGINTSIKEFVKLGLPMSNPDVNLGLLQNLPGGIGKPGSNLAKFSNITQNGITSVRAHMVKTELLNMKAAGRTVDEAAVSEAIRKIKLISGASIHKSVKGADTFIQFPNWLQSQFEFIGHSAVGMPALAGLTAASPESMFAAKAMLRLVGLGLATTYAVNAMGGKKTEYDNGVPRMRIGDTKIDVFGPYGALARGMYAGLQGDPEALIRSRVSPLFQIGWDLGTGKTFIGDTASFNDPEYWATALGPYSLTSAARSGGDPEIALLQGAGVRATKVNSFQLMREQAQETMGLDWVELSGNQKEALRRANPALVADLEQKTLEKAKNGDPYAKAAIATEELNNQLLEQQQTLNLLRQNGKISPRQLRDGLRAVQQAVAERKQQIRKDYDLDKLTSNTSEAQVALNGYFDLFTKADSGILEGGVKSGIIDWDTFEQLESEFMRSLTPQQQKVVTDKFVRRDPSLDWYYANKQIVQESGYFDAVDVAFERIKPQAKAFDKSIETYNDLRQAYFKANNEGNVGKVMRLNALLNLTSKHLTLMRSVLERENPLLYKALVQNGYKEQALSKPLAANIR